MYTVYCLVWLLISGWLIRTRTNTYTKKPRTDTAEASHFIDILREEYIEIELFWLFSTCLLVKWFINLQSLNISLTMLSMFSCRVLVLLRKRSRNYLGNSCLNFCLIKIMAYWTQAHMGYPARHICDYNCTFCRHIFNHNNLRGR